MASGGKEAEPVGMSGTDHAQGGPGPHMALIVGLGAWHSVLEAELVKETRSSSSDFTGKRAQDP